LTANLLGHFKGKGIPEDLKNRRGWDSQVSRQSAYRDSKIFSPTHRPPLPLALIPVTGWVDPRAIVRPEWLCRWKIPAQCLNQPRHRVTP